MVLGFVVCFYFGILFRSYLGESIFILCFYLLFRKINCNF